MTDRDKRGYGSGIGKEYHNDPESHYRKIVEERQETTNRDRLYTDITECEAVVISDRGGEYGGTTDREVQTDQSGTTTYTSVIIRFIGPSDNPSFHPDQAKKDPLSAKNKEEFLQLRSLNSSRAVKEPMLYGLIGEPEIGNIVRCTKRNNIWEINAVYERSHQPYDDFVNRMANPNADSSQAAFNGKPAGYGFQPTQLGNNQATNYTPADRKNVPGKPPEQQTIKYIVLHSTGGSSGAGKAQGTINRFADAPTISYTDPQTGKKNPPCTDYPNELPHGTICHPTRQKIETPVPTSIHYAVDQGGSVIQGVLEKDVANHVRGYNGTSIGIEMTGEPHDGPGLGLAGKYSKMYTFTLVSVTAQLVANICKNNNLPLNRDVIKGHEELDPTRRYDPGASYGSGYWDWPDFMKRVKQHYDGDLVQDGV